MSRYRGPKNKLARREGVDLGLKTPGSAAHTSLLRRIKILPGQTSRRAGRRKTSDYGIQLREKQKVKRMYGISEKQFSRNFNIAAKEKGNTGTVLLANLERRLDNTIYRLHLAATRSQARQMVTHGHVQVDGKKVNIPSFLVSKDMVIILKQKMLETPLVKKMLEDKNPTIVSYLTRKGPVGKVIRLPQGDDIPEDINVQLIIEFYSRQ